MPVTVPGAGYAGRTRTTLLEYEAVLANASIGIAFTRERRFFLCNPKFAEMFGWSADELVGQSGDVVYASPDSYQALGQIAVPILSAGRQLDIEWEMRRRDGTLILCRIIAKAINPAQTQQGTVWIAEDITGRRRQADELARLAREQEAILDTAQIGICFVREGRIVRTNRRFEEMHGYSPGEMAGLSTKVIFARESDHDQVAEGSARLAQGGSYTAESEARRKDGSTFWSRLTGRAVDPPDRAKGSVWLDEDITEQRRAAEHLARVLAEQQALLDNVVVGIAFFRDRVLQRCSRRFEELFGYAPGEASGAPARRFYFTDEDYAAGTQAYRELGTDRAHAREQWLRRNDGSGFWCRVSGRPLDPANPARGAVWLFEDISERRRADEALQRLVREQNALLDSAMIGIAFIQDRCVMRCNRRFEELFGYAHGELLHQSTRLLYAVAGEFEQVEARYERIWAGERHDAERRMRRKDGSEFQCHLVGRAVQPGDPSQGSVWTFDDVTAEHAARESLEASREALEHAVAERTAALKAANERLEAEIADRRQAEDRAKHLADHDPLTGLPNRRLLEDRLTQALALSQRNRKQTAVIFVDLDRFKAINDTLGHAVGDALLKEVAVRLAKQLRVGDTICRVGGDEFIIVLPELKRGADAAQVAQKVIEGLSLPIRVLEQDLAVTPSIGISVYPDDGRDAETLIRNADAAMYHAKETGRGNYQFFTEQMNLAASRRVALENDLRRALERDELLIYYQPVCEAREGRVVAHEALLRWKHPSRGLVSPAEFIQVAEDSGLIMRIGEWVMEQACRWATFIGAERGLRVSVNLSARQFADPRLADIVARILRETGLPASQFELEVVEATLMQQPEVAQHTLKKLKAIGVSVAVDNFGSGQSSLAMLQRQHVDRLKIDRSLVAPLPADSDSRAVVAAIVGVAHALGLQAVAEGVEAEAQREFLRECGCDCVQGYLMGRPQDADSAAKDYV